MILYSPNFFKPEFSVNKNRFYSERQQKTPLVEPKKKQNDDVKIKFVYETNKIPSESFLKLVKRRLTIMTERIYVFMQSVVVEEEIR